MKQTSRGLAPSLNTGHSTFTGARQRLAVALVAIVIAFAGAQTAGAQTLCNVKFDIRGGGTVKLQREGQWLEVTNKQTIPCLIPSVSALTITPETGYVVPSITCDATDGLSIFLDQRDDFQWNLNINPYLGSDTPTITVRIVFDKGLAGGADEASAVALTADNDLSHLAGGWYKVESDLTLYHTVNLHGDTHITIATGATLTVSTSGEYGISGSALTDENGISGYALTVSGEGKLAVSANQSAIYVDNYTQMGCAVTLSGDTHGLNAENNVSISGGSLTTSGAYYGIDTNIGSITISGGTVSSSGEQCGLWAGDAVSITGGTVSASGDDYGIRGYSVSITGGQVTASSGGIMSIFGDITLGWTSATDYITASGYFLQNDGYHVKIADGQKLYGDGFPSASFKGTVDDPSALNGLMLRPTAAVTKSGTNEYTIWNAAGWDAFCDALQDNDTYNRFSGKTVKLGADITVSRMAGSDHHDFCGTFDGQGYTLTFTSTENVNGVAPFSYVSETTPTGGTEVSHPAIRNLNVVADINTTAQYASALVGRMWGTLTIEGCTVGGTIQTSNKYAAGFIAEQNGIANITDCKSSVTIKSDVNGDGTHGGFVAVPGNTLNITGCVFDGKLLTTNSTTKCGGFVGWHNSKTIKVSNSIYAPAAIAGGEMAITDESATFVRGGGTVTNSYYTATLGTAQGKQAHSIKRGANVTTNGTYIGESEDIIAHAGVATPYSVSGITAYKATDAHSASDPFIAGLLYNNVLYAGAEEAVSLTLANTPPDGYGFGGYTVRTGGATLTEDGDNYTLTMPNADVWVQAMFELLPITVSYIDENGETKTVTNAIDLSLYDGDEIPAGSVCSFSSESMTGEFLTIAGDITIILPDDLEISADGIFGDYTVTFYGQEKGNGKLNAGDYINGNVTVYGGILTITNGDGHHAQVDGSVTVYGGNVRIEGNISSDVYLSWTKLSDSFYANSIPGSVTIADGKTFYDEDGNEYSGDVFNSNDLAGKTLRPYDCRLALSDDADNTAAIAAANGKVYNVTLSGRTLYKDGAWNTLCLPFALGDDQAESGHELDGTPLEGATLMTLGNSPACNTGFDAQTGTLNLDFLPATTVEPGVAYIVKWPIPDGMTPDDFAAAYAANPDDYDLKNPVFTGVTVTNDAPADHATTSLDGYVTFIGTYGPAAIYADPAVNLYLGSGNTLYWPSTDGYTVNAFRAYFQLGNGLTCGDPSNPNAARAITLNFGDASEQTGIVEITDPTPGPSPAWEGSAAGWYSMDGRKLQGQPTKSGLYIHGGKKVVIK